MAKGGAYLKEVRAEMKSITWPTAQTVRNNTLVVLAFCLVLVVVVYALDTLFSWGIGVLVK